MRKLNARLSIMLDLGEALVVATHPGIMCEHCELEPVRGPRLKCRVCDDFNLCQQCFNSSLTGHRHPFSWISQPGGAAVYAGRPGRKLLKAPASNEPAADAEQTSSRPSSNDNSRHNIHGIVNGGLLTDWERCVKTLWVSSRENWAHRLLDRTSSYWQSCGMQGKVNTLLFFALLCFAFSFPFPLLTNWLVTFAISIGSEWKCTPMLWFIH